MPTITKSDPRLWAIAFSILLSLITAWQFYINVDGIYYLKAAEAFLNNNPHHGLRWPFYPILIAKLSQITDLSLLNSALIIQGLLQILLVVTFINIIRILGGSTTVQWLAAAVILLHPQLNEYRGEIIRDFGYWAFLLLSFYYLLRYVQRPQWKHCIFWSACVLVATLFRIEGVAIIAFTPLTLFLLPLSWPERWGHVLRFYSPWIIILVLGLSVLLFYQTDMATLGRLNDMSKWWLYFTHNFTTQWETMQMGITPALPDLLKSRTSLFLLGGFLVYFLSILLSTLQPLFAGLAIFGQYQQALQKVIGKNEKRILYGFLAINLLIPILILLFRWYVTSRFVMPFVLLILLMVPFALYVLYTLWKQSRYANYIWPARILVAIVGIVLFIDGVYSYGSPGVIVKEAGSWIQNNAPENASVFSNNPQLAFYANRPGMDLSAQNIDVPLTAGLNNNQWQHYDYLALVVKRKKYEDQKLIEQTLKGAPIAHFENKRGDQVLIFSVCKKSITSRVTCSLS